MRVVTRGIVWAMASLLFAGCGPAVSEEELGRVVDEVPEIPPGYDPYELPEPSTLQGESPDGDQSAPPSGGPGGEA
jgi:hypothetical protein